MGARHDDLVIDVMKRKNKQDMPVLPAIPSSARIRPNLEYIRPMSNDAQFSTRSSVMKESKKMLIIENDSHCSFPSPRRGYHPT